MRCPECDKRNSVAATKCSACGHKFKRKPVPWFIWAGIGAVTLAVAAWGVTSTMVPSLNDPSQSLSRVAKKIAAGPSSPEDAKEQKQHFDEEIKNFITTNAKLSTPELTKKLGTNLGSQAFEVHGFDLPRNLRVIEIDTILQASDYLVMNTTGGTKVFSLPGFEVFDSAQLIKDQTGASLVLVGHSAGQGNHHPEVKVYALLPDDIRDESTNSVPPIMGDGAANFAPNKKDVIADMSLYSVGVADHLFRPLAPDSDKNIDETVRKNLIWRDGRYSITQTIGNSPLSALYAVARCLQKPSLIGHYSSYLSPKAVKFIAKYDTRLEAPNFSICKVSVTAKKQNSPTTAHLLLGGAGKNFLLDIEQDPRSTDGRYIANNIVRADDNIVTFGLHQNPQIASVINSPDGGVDPALNPHHATIIEKKVEDEKVANPKSTKNGNASIEDQIISSKEQSVKATSRRSADETDNTFPKSNTETVAFKKESDAGSSQQKAGNDQPTKVALLNGTGTTVTTLPGTPAKLSTESSKSAAKVKTVPAPITIQTAPNTAPKPLSLSNTNMKTGASQAVTEKVKTKEEKAIADKARDEQAKADKAKSDKATADKVKSDKAIADKVKSERALIEKAKSDKALADKAESADRALADKVKSDKALADKAKSDRAIADKKTREDTARAEKAKSEEAKASKNRTDKTKEPETKNSRDQQAKSFSPEGSSAARLSNKIKNGTVRVRVGPGAEYREIGFVNKGTEFAILGEKKGWYRVKANGQVGYVLSSLVERPAGAPPVKQEASVTGSQAVPGSRHYHFGPPGKHSKHSKSEPKPQTKNIPEPPQFVP